MCCFCIQLIDSKIGKCMIFCVTNIMFDLKNEFDFITRDRKLLQISTKISGAVFPLHGINSSSAFAFLRSIY
jgi:hypothetical protein